MTGRCESPTRLGPLRASTRTGRPNRGRSAGGGPRPSRRPGRCSGSAPSCGLRVARRVLDGAVGEGTVGEEVDGIGAEAHRHLERGAGIGAAIRLDHAEPGEELVLCRRVDRSGSEAGHGDRLIVVEDHREPLGELEVDDAPPQLDLGAGEAAVVGHAPRAVDDEDDGLRGRADAIETSPAPGGQLRPGDRLAVTVTCGPAGEHRALGASRRLLGREHPRLVGRFRDGLRRRLRLGLGGRLGRGAGGRGPGRGGRAVLRSGRDLGPGRPHREQDEGDAEGHRADSGHRSRPLQGPGGGRMPQLDTRVVKPARL